MLFENKESLEKQIEYCREKMIQTGIKYGFTNEKTIKASEELDALLNKLLYYNQMETTY